MGRYQISYSNKQAGYNPKPEIHPVWRGVGFAMIILIPILSYFAGLLLIAANKARDWIPIPPELVNKLTADPDLYLKIIMTIVISFFIYVIFMLVTFVTHRLFAPSSLGPTDAPPIRRKVRRSR